MMYFSKINIFFISFIFLSPTSFCMKSTLYSHGDTSCPQGMSNFPPNIDPQNQNIPQGPIDEIMPPDDESYNKAISSILKCINVLECFIKNSVVIDGKVHLEGGFYNYLEDEFSSDVLKYNCKSVSVLDPPFLWCYILLKITVNSIFDCSILKNDAECVEVCQCLNNLCVNVFNSEGNQFVRKCVIPFSDFFKVVDAAFKLYGFLNKYSRYQDNVSNESITDGYVYTFLSYLRDIFISVDSALMFEKNGKEISKETICRNIQSYITKQGDNLILFDLYRVTMLYYYYFHKELVRLCGEKVIDDKFDFHSSFINLIDDLCYVYDIFEKVKNFKGQINYNVIVNLETFKMRVQCIKNKIIEIFEFFSSNSDFLNKQKEVIKKCKIENVEITKNHTGTRVNEMFLGLVENIKEKGMYVNTKKINPKYLNNNCNLLSMNNFNNDDFFNNNTSFEKEGNVRKPLEETIDDVTSNRLSCCSCQRRRQ